MNRRRPLILHIAKRDAWERAKAEDFYSPDSLSKEGFIHCSTHEQLASTANRFFKGQHGLLLLHIDAAKVRPEIRREGPEPFPHVYGSLNLDAVIEVESFEPGEDGTFGPPAGGGSRRLERSQ